jgi:hypothetical protein
VFALIGLIYYVKGALDTKWLPLNLPSEVWKIVSVIAYNLDERYHKHVFICVRRSEVEATISNEYISHIDTCRSACMDAFEALLGRNQEGYVSACHDSCRKIVRKDAYDSLYATYMKLTDELEKMGYKYTAKFDKEDVPQTLKVTVWF